ncbi:glycosyltransferase family A protein [Aliivibrio fischeri]|uniref:glycosyltransferase family A protein n=1 Tax=Aliivibrio fischeri TaxID=668 RepID=UPI000907E45E|nr:glycosyltransferase family A protein [Aliivibrio fischeri]
MQDIVYSVIIPHYNSVDSLRVLLASIPRRKDIEVIVIDDSSDVTPEILFTEFNFKYFTNTGLKGAGSARNIGIDNSSGRYFLFADSDDYFLENSFDIFDMYVKNVPNLDVVYFSPTSIKDNDKKSKRHNKYSLLVNDFIEKGDETLRYRFHVPWSKLICSKLVHLHNIRFDEVIASNDVNFSLKVGFYGSVIKADKRNVYCVVEKEGTLTKQTSEKVIDSRFDALCRYNEFVFHNNRMDLKYAMSTHIYSSLKFGLNKGLYRFFYCRYKNYPIFHDVKHVITAFKKLL